MESRESAEAEPTKVHRHSTGEFRLTTALPPRTAEGPVERVESGVFLLSSSEADEALEKTRIPGKPGPWGVMDEKAIPLLFKYAASAMRTDKSIVPEDGIVVAVGCLNHVELSHEWEGVSLKSFEVEGARARLKVYMRAAPLRSTDRDRRVIYFLAIIHRLPTGKCSLAVKFVPLKDEALRSGIERKRLSMESFKTWALLEKSFSIK